MISFDEAIAELKAMARPLEKIVLPLDEAAGHVLTDAITARLPSPRMHASAMDGYAIRAADLPGPFDIAGESAAGMAEAPPIGPGQTVRIYTGAPLPERADRIVIQELTERDGDRLSITGDIGNELWVRPKGSDFEAGTTLLAKGALLGPGQLIVAAAADRDRVSVWRRARVAILTTGDELALPSTASDRPGTIPDSISPGIAALVQDRGGIVSALRRVKDDAAAIEGEASASLRNCDILVVVGGASVGARDFAKHSVAGGQFQHLFAKVAMQPGKPVWCAASGGGQYVLGLPGNPVSAIVTARLFLAPLLYAAAGREFDDALRWKDCTLDGPDVSARPREQFARAVRQGENIAMVPNQLSSSQRSLATADTLARIPPGDARYPAGTTLRCLDL